MDTLTLSEISKILRISDHTARNRLSMGMPMPPSFRVGKRRLFIKTEVEIWLEAQKTGSSPPMPALQRAAASPIAAKHGGQTMT
ncbi:MAG: helix-turn-helix domain-containing protein [Oxalobacteraceae bacterium]|nr:helix-turn-helix domain-containing protein [Oxalobacteraceae bacterium]